MLSNRTLHISKLCHDFKTAFRSMCHVVPKSNVVPDDLNNLAKQLGINNEILAKVFNNHQEKFKLYTESQWIKLFHYLKQYDFKSSELLEIVDSNPDVLNVNRHNLHKCMTAWNNFRFDDKKLRQLFVFQPCCLLMDEKQILSRIPKLLAFVGNKQNRILELISYSPNVLFDNWDHIESKLDYILLDMELGPTQFVTTSVLSSTLFDIKCRHNFLIKLGMYKKRDPKSNTNQISENPSLKRIIETSDKQFAVKVAGVTAEEFFVFKSLFKKQLHEKNKDDSDHEYEEDEN